MNRKLVDSRKQMQTLIEKDDDSGQEVVHLHRKIASLEREKVELSFFWRVYVFLSHNNGFHI